MAQALRKLMLFILPAFGLFGCGNGPESVADPLPTVEGILALYRDGQPEKARDAALRLAEAPPADPADRTALARFLTDVGRSADAVRVLEAGADTPAARAALAQALLKSGRREDCRALLDSMEQTGESPACTCLLRGIDLHLQGEHSAARTSLEAAQRHAPDDPEIWAWRGWMILSDGDAKRAEAHLREGLRQFPESREVRSNLSGLLFRVRGRDERTLEEVVELCESVVRRHPFDRLSRVRMGLALNRLRRHVSAVAVFLDLTREFPNQGEYWANLGIAQLGAGRPRAAVRSLVNALRLLPEDPVLRTSLGNAYVELAEEEKFREEMLKKALGVFDAVLRTDPDHVPAYVGKARSLVKLKAKDDEALKSAIVLYEQALERDPECFEALLNVALLYYDLTVLTMKEGQRNEWYWKAMERFRGADGIQPAIEWDRGARAAFEDLKNK